MKLKRGGSAAKKYGAVANEAYHIASYIIISPLISWQYQEELEE